MKQGKHALVKERPRVRKKRAATVYVVLVMLLLAVPFLAMPLAPYDADAELQQLAPLPEISSEGSPRVDYLAQVGDWFDDHFAFRQQLITANAWVRTNVLGTSPTDQVVVGTDGWLYYGGTMADYQRTRQMSDRGIDNAAFNMALLQEYVESQDSQFALAIAPNKNSLYGEHMPYYEKEGTGATNRERLAARLADYGVNQVDLYTVLDEADDELYMKTDSHWNTEGARRAYDALMTELGKGHEEYRNASITMDANFVGDLEAMLYPLDQKPEPLEVYDAAQRFTYTNDTSSTADSFIMTASTVGESSDTLLMYRDSFGNALLPFFATAFETACFSKMVPYNFMNLDEVDANYVIVERAERHLDFFATDPPLIPAPVRAGLTVGQVVTTASTVESASNGPYTQVQGVLDATYVPDGSRIYLAVEMEDGSEVWYEAFHKSVGKNEGSEVSSDYGYSLNIGTDALPSGTFQARVVVVANDTGTALASTTLERK